MMQLVPGLVSITFRRLAWQEVLARAADAGLEAIEWGGDVHCPHGDTACAVEIGSATRARGLSVCAYGSYYRLGAPAGSGPDFSAVLESAVALRAPRIRVWAGAAGTAATDADQRARIVADARECAERAAAHGIEVCSEWHGGTLTDSGPAGAAFLREVAHPGFTTFWQPGVGLDPTQALDELAAVAAHVTQLHVFHWRGHERLPLMQGEAAWCAYVAAAARACTARRQRDLVAALEFLPGDDPNTLVAETSALRRILASAAMSSS